MPPPSAAPCTRAKRRSLAQRDRAVEVRETTCVGDVVLERCCPLPPHPVEIGSRRKALALSGEHDGPDIPVRIDRRECGREIGDERLVEGVVDLGTVHPDPGGRSAALQS